jgi:serine protease inhibitor
LKNVLTKLGLGAGFSNNADFSQITTDEQLKISEVVHKGFIEVSLIFCVLAQPYACPVSFRV